MHDSLGEGMVKEEMVKEGNGKRLNGEGEKMVSSSKEGK